MGSTRLPLRALAADLLPALCGLASIASATTDPPPEAVLATLPFLGDEPNRVYVDHEFDLPALPGAGASESGTPDGEPR